MTTEKNLYEQGIETHEQPTGRTLGHARTAMTTTSSGPGHDTPTAHEHGEEAVEIVAARLLADHNAGYDAGTEQEHYSHTPLWIERKAKRLVAVLSSAGLLATEQEWGVHAGDADLPAGSITTYSTRERALSQQEYIGGTVVSRGVTAWREA